MFLRLSLCVLMLLAACDGGGASRDSSPPSIPGSTADQWTIGPIIGGKDYSVGMPLHPTACAEGLFCIDFPGGPESHAHYVTFRHGPLTGKTRIVLRYRVEMDPGVQLVAKSVPGAASIISLHFQREGDDWSAKGRYETYRWYASWAMQTPIEPGEHEIVAPLDGPWTAVMTSSAMTAPEAFRDAIDHADQVGFVLGGGDGLGHGVYATGPARLIVTEFRVE